MKNKSISWRLLFSTGLVLTVFFILATFVLEKSFQQSAEQALQEKLQIRIYALLSAAELSAQGLLQINDDLHEPRYGNPGSGLYAYISNTDHQLSWRSASSLGLDIKVGKKLQPGTADFYLHESGWYIMHYPVIWEDEQHDEQLYVFSVAEDAAAIVHQLDSFKKTLRSWLIVIALLSLLTQVLVLRWGLKPLRDISKDLTAIEQGKKSRLQGDYATELQGLANNINALISSERVHAERYRNTLADLAHSLKTPLTIMRGCAQTGKMPEPELNTISAQITQMNGIVEYQLQRAAAQGKQQLSTRIDLLDIVDKILSSLQIVNKDKQVQVQQDICKPCQVYYESGDMYEILGNLLDNAFKWCQQQVHIQIQMQQDTTYSLLIVIEDDGPGIAEQQLQAILKRGVRADEKIQGHGIGMAVVNELVNLLQGELRGTASRTLGGMRWQIYLP